MKTRHARRIRAAIRKARRVMAQCLKAGMGPDLRYSIYRMEEPFWPLDSRVFWHTLAADEFDRLNITWARHHEQQYT